MSSDDLTSVVPAPAQPSLTAEHRQRLIEQFERWLDRMSADEAPPAGLPQELLAELENGDVEAQRHCDLYTLFSALTSLTGEIRLQGRAFKQLADLLAPLSQMPMQLDRLRERDEQQEGTTDLPVSGKEICEALIDLYDRLARGLENCDKGILSMQQRRHGWLKRWFGATRARHEAAASTMALRDAAALTLARLDAIFNQWGIERIGQIGEPFDPLRMSAMHVLPSGEFEPGSVLEINRSGYALHGQVKATAQVTVARAPSAELLQPPG